MRYDTFIIPEDVRNIIDTIEKKGMQAYAVGGCVRDSILGRHPDDWDITTSACTWETARWAGSRMHRMMPSW